MEAQLSGCCVRQDQGFTSSRDSAWRDQPAVTAAGSGAPEMPRRSCLYSGRWQPWAAPSAYYAAKGRRPGRRQVTDEALKAHIARIHAEACTAPPLSHRRGAICRRLHNWPRRWPARWPAGR